MSIRPALCTAAFPQMPVEKVIQLAGDMGYQGLDFVTRFGRSTPDFQCDIQQGDAQRIADQLRQANIAPVCVSTNISLATDDPQEGQAALAMLRSAGQRAAAIGAPALRVLAWEPARSRNPRKIMTRLATLARQGADELAAMGVQLLFENLGSMSLARDWWACLEAISHPMIGLYWNAADSALANQSPAVWAPTLNSRIRIVRLNDYRIQGNQAVPVALGQGELPVTQIMHRLLGVGYQGFVTVHWDRLASPELSSDPAPLAEARQLLANLLEPPAPVTPARKPAARPAAVRTAAAKADSGASQAVVAEAKGKTDDSPTPGSVSAKPTADGSSEKPDPRAAALARIAAMREKRAQAAANKPSDAADAANAQDDQPQQETAKPKAPQAAPADSAGTSEDDAKQAAKAAARAAAKARMEALKKQRAQAKDS